VVCAYRLIIFIAWHEKNQALKSLLPLYRPNAIRSVWRLNRLYILF